MLEEHRSNLYDSIRQIREDKNQPYYRILLAGYFSDEDVKKQDIDTEKYLRESIAPFLRNLTGYLFIKGLFYIHLIESKDIKHINAYIKHFYTLDEQKPDLHKGIRIVYQSYENPTCFFKGWECDNNPQSGPVLIDTDKTEEQIADRSFEIYEHLEDGAKRKKENASFKIGNMFLLSNDDMAILICDRFMTLKEYSELYLSEGTADKEAEQNYPLPPSIFNVMEFLEIQNYQDFK